MTVEFLPDQSRPSSAITDASGNYELKFNERLKGAAVGKHKVRITKPMNPEDLKDELPPKYNANTELTADVEEGVNTINFELLSK